MNRCIHCDRDTGSDIDVCETCDLANVRADTIETNILCDAMLATVDTLIAQVKAERAAERGRS